MAKLEKILTTYQISKLCSVDLSTVITWIDQGKLPAYRTPGGHRRVKLDDFLAFVKKYNLPMPSEIDVELNPKVLIIDDEPGIIKLITKAIKKQDSDIKIESAMDGFEAGRKILDFLPDLIILDLKLPGVDGFEICKAIKRDERLKDTKILAITAYATPENKKKILESGADDFISKPFEIGDLMISVNKLLSIET